MRVYVPVTASDVSAERVSARRAHAVTAALAAALPEEDEEGLEVSASMCAADSSVVLLAEPERAEDASVRIVVAADVPADVVRECAVSDDVLPGTVELLTDVEWADVAALLADELDAAEDVSAARQGDDDAFERTAERDLLWYDISEREHLAHLLSRA